MQIAIEERTCSQRMPMESRAAKLMPTRGTYEVAQLPMLWLLSGAAVVAFAVLVSLHAGNVPGWTAFEDLSETVVAAIAGLACASRAKRDRREHAADAREAAGAWRAWRLLAFGLGAWALGHAVWTVTEVGLGITPGRPSIIDA